MRPRDDERGQAFTLEAVVAAIVMLTAVAFALQVTIVTPLSASTSSQHIEGQQRSVAQGVLASAAEDGSLKEAVLYRNATSGRFHGAITQGYYTNATSSPADIEFLQKLDQALSEEGIAYNVIVRYQTTNNEIDSETMIRQGTPSDNAVSATWTLSLRNDDHLVNADGSQNETTVSEANFYIRNGPANNAGKKDHGLYNVVTVEVVAWRI